MSKTLSEIKLKLHKTKKKNLNKIHQSYIICVFVLYFMNIPYIKYK